MSLTKVTKSMIVGDSVNVLDFGADATGVADSTSAIRDAITYAQTNSTGRSGTVELPAGTFKTTGTLTVTGSIWLKGAGAGTTQIRLTSASIIPAIKIDASTTSMLGGGVSDIFIDAGTNCDGLVVRALSPQAISRYTVQNLSVYNCRDGVNISSDTGNVVYQSIFRNILVVNPTRYGVTTNSIAYCTFDNLEVTQVTSTAYAYNLNDMACTYRQLTCDGISFINCAEGIVDGFTVETINAAVPLFNSFCIKFNNVAFARNIYLINVDNAKCPYAITTGVATMHISGVFFYDVGTTPSTYPLALDPASNGIIENFNPTPGGLLIENYETAANLTHWKFLNCPTLTKISNLGTNLIPSTSTLSGVAIAGTAGQFTCTSTVLIVGQAIVLSGTYGGTGSITGYTNPKTYYIIATNGTTTFTLSASLGGGAITTTAGTPTGITYTLAILPVPGEKYRGNLQVIAGVAGVADHTYSCQKNISDVYVWTQLDN